PLSHPTSLSMLTYTPSSFRYPLSPTRRSSDLVYYRYWEHDDPEHHAPAHYGVRTPTHKYIHYYNDGLGTPGRRCSSGCTCGWGCDRKSTRLNSSHVSISYADFCL